MKEYIIGSNPNLSCLQYFWLMYAKQSKPIKNQSSKNYLNTK